MKTIRCAVYTRKSTEDGLEKEFNTLEAQRESGENYIKSQAYQGWEIIPTHYDDGGFSGGTLKRPALQQLLKDVEAGMVDMIVVYKIDRLTRSLIDFLLLNLSGRLLPNVSGIKWTLPKRRACGWVVFYRLVMFP